MPRPNNLADLVHWREAPTLEDDLADRLRRELATAMAEAEWFTIGVMAPSSGAALEALRRLETQQGWNPMQVVQTTEEAGPVFLKANQINGSIRIRIEHGLGQGILISGHRHETPDDQAGMVNTWGPLPLDFF
ncbi:hypothetical protein KR100_10935 [Synechococcus sp. KORDI-100]|uniref:DUF1824 family protein n=1 Tax=Synechococcus sp. KORDI-100 TaxID=1280380 RepID=UPI0004E08774|nr:DUF1824 family protein [Synechococcus sp. KORDI-100]AII43872.1 hypothetical protein KR100_10935 [Synechococcus sp. KORDI-100]